MKKLYISFFAVFSILLDGCLSECRTVDYGRFQATFYNERRETLSSITIAVYPLRFGIFNNHYNSNLTSLAMVKDYYGAQILETDEKGYLDIQVNEDDGTSSCDGPRETFDNGFQSIVIFYQCDDGIMKHQEYMLDNGLTFRNSVNQIDSAFIDSGCIQ
ncbi:MAG: hypothetical protein ABI663_22480 [Chryseolinea sp.]